MSFYKVKIYVKMVGIALVFLIVVIFMASNREAVSIKFLGWQIWQAPLFAFIFAMASLGVIIFLITRKIRKVFGDVKELRREEKSRKKLVEEVKKAVEQKGNSS